MMYFFNKNLLSGGMLLVSLAMLFLFVQPRYFEVSELREKQSEYRKYLDDANEVRIIRGRLLASKGSVSEDQWGKLKKILPDKLDQAELLLNLGDLALSHAIVLKDFEARELMMEAEGGQQQFLPVDDFGDFGVDLSEQETTGRDYGILEFAINTSASYRNFIGFLGTVERKLQLIDVVGVDIKSENKSEGIYDIQVKARSYWLK